jgi:hypothetical protein
MRILLFYRRKKMAIITCPECGQNPVSDRATACPKCGCPIAAGSIPAVPVDASSGSTHQALTIRQQREAQLPRGVSLSESSEFADASVYVGSLNVFSLPEIVEKIQGWCEELRLGSGVRKTHIDVIGHLSALKSLYIGSGELDDEALLRISKLQTLTKLKIGFIEGRTSAVGWLQLAKLGRLELLVLPTFLLDGDHDQDLQIKQELRQRLPQTIVK